MSAHDLSRDYRAERMDRIEEEAQSAYDAMFTRIAERLKAEAIAEGADEDYRPSGAEVHRLVKIALRRNDD